MELLAEITAIQHIILKNFVVISITPEQWKAYWKMVNEETSSSESGLHFGHYIVGCKSEIIAHTMRPGSRSYSHTRSSSSGGLGGSQLC